jgi:dTDP-4-amino-4,6-dideoxygalactose transaminase
MSGVVQFLDLGRVTAALRPEIDRAIADVVDSGRYVLGDAVRDFEQAFGDMLGAHAVGVASGTDAIEIALRALGIGAGAEVVTQANTCPPTVAAIARTGAVPVLCDVELDSGRIDPESLAAAIGPRTRAVVPVHLYGQPVDMAAIADVAEAHGVAIVEDCAQAHAAAFDGRPVGTIGAAGCFSFYPTKNLGALGDGGMVVTTDSALADAMIDLRQYGAFGTAVACGVGINSRLDEIQAAVLGAKLPTLDAWTRRRLAIAERYRAALDGSSLEALAVDGRARHVHHLFVVRTAARDRVRQDLLARGIETLIHYPTPIHRLPAYASAVRTPVPLGRAEQLAAQVLSLPLYPQMSDGEVDAVAEAIAAVSATPLR